MLWCAVARADDTEPVPNASYVRVEPSYTWPGGEELALRGLFVAHGERVASAFGVDVAADRDGISGLALTQLSGVAHDWGVIGAGVSVALPTTSGDPVRVGPAWFIQSSTLPIELSALARTYFAVSSGRGDAFVTRLEPSASVTLPGEFVLSSDGEIDIAWLAGAARVPVNLELAHPLGAHVVIRGGPEVVVAGRDRGAVKLDLQIDIEP